MRESGFDYMKFTVDSNGCDGFLQWLFRGFEPRWMGGATHRGYREGYHETKTGVRVYRDNYFSSEVLVEMGGTALRNIHYVLGKDANTVFQFAIQHGARFSRVDFAVNVPYFSPTSLCKGLRLDSGRKGNTAKISYMVSNGIGTAMLGSRTSDKYVRVYDFGFVHETRSFETTRIEIEVKGKLAQSLCKFMEHKPFCEVDKWFCQQIRSVADFRVDMWGFALDVGDTSLQSVAQRDTSDTKAWLLKLVARSLAKYINRSGDKGFLGEFIAVVESLLE
jgi:hypothetical protein